MATSTTKTNKPLNPRGNDQSPLAYNRAKLYSGKALDFDGVNDHIDCGTLDITNYTAISVAMYLKADSVTSTDIPFSLKHTGADDIRFVTELNGLTYAIDDGTLYQVQTPINVNEWYYAVLTFDGSTLTAYLNGQAVESIAASFDFSTADGALRIGERVNGSLDFDGQIANVKIFNTALTAAQVADLYNNPEKVVPTGVDNTALKLWLPMMEGAGTTAYDGSGNGNHGTISGATYVNGVGSPVAQSAVIDWNKGSNEFLYSEDITNAVWGASDATRTANVSTAPDGQTTADKITPNTTNDYHNIRQTASVTNGQVYRFSTFLKADGYDYILLNTPTGSSQGNAGPVVNLTNGSVVASLVTDYNASVTDAGNGWYKVEFDYTTSSTSARIDWNVLPTSAIATYSGDGTKGVLVWGSSIRLASSGSNYVPTLSTAQTSPVLLPQGLTSGRDITGVNLFENVRKQGALNLDGNSWAEVHDNGSLDFGTGSFTFEAWAKYSYVSQGSSLNAILSLGGDIGQGAGYGRAGLVSSSSGSSMSFFYNSTGNTSTSSFSDGDWVHVVGVYDETSVIVYINGAEERTTARTAASMTNTDVKQIGRDSTAIRYYNDQIAQPRIYNRALTAEEVQRNYNAGKNTYTN